MILLKGGKTIILVIKIIEKHKLKTKWIWTFDKRGPKTLLLFLVSSNSMNCNLMDYKKYFAFKSLYLNRTIYRVYVLF